MNYAEKQNNANYHFKKQDNTYFFEEDPIYKAPIEIPKRFLSLFKSCDSNSKIIIKDENFIVAKKPSPSSSKTSQSSSKVLKTKTQETKKD